MVLICLGDLKELKPRNDKMDNYELKKVTQGKNRRQSLIFHVYDNVKRQDYELLIDHVCQNTGDTIYGT